MAGKGRPKGIPKTGGRQKGSANKATAEVKAIAQKYTTEAIAELARIAFESDQDTARIAACKEILDRGHGKAHQYTEQKTTIEYEEVSNIELARRISFLLNEGLAEIPKTH